MRISKLIIALCSLALLPVSVMAQQDTIQGAEIKLRPVDVAKSYRRISLLTNEYVAYNDLSPRKQRMIVQDVGYRNLLLKFRRNRGYYVNQPFVAADRAKFAVMAQYAYYVSLVLGFQNTLTDYYMFEPLATINSVDNRNFDFEVAGGYFIKNNFAVGVRFGYGLKDDRVKLESPIFELTSNTKDMFFNRAKTTFTGGVFMKNFIPVDPDQQLFIINETNLKYIYQYGLVRDQFQEGARLSKTEEWRHTIGIGVTPGILYFLTPGLSLEFLISPMFVFYEHRTLLNNEIEHGSMGGGGLNFVLTPLNMNFGITYFFGLNERKGYKRGVY